MSDRETEFRTWLGNEKSPGSNEYMLYSSDFPSLSKFFEAYQARKGNAKSLMQYTGLKDKNGKKIHESDLLKLDEGQLWVVAFDNRACFIAHDAISKLEKALLDDYDFEVIGNIYENPELLEVG